MLLCNSSNIRCWLKLYIQTTLGQNPSKYLRSHIQFSTKLFYHRFPVLSIPWVEWYEKIFPDNLSGSEIHLWTTRPHFHFLVYTKRLLRKMRKSHITKAFRNECAADTTGIVQRGLGALTQQAKFANRILFTLLANLWTCTGLHCLPKSEHP